MPSYLMGIDNVPPASHVERLPTCWSDGPFDVRWTGSDAGTGVAAYDIQVRDGPDMAWTDWLTDTTEHTAAYTGQMWHTYYFRSRARDWAGNQEPYPAAADAQITMGCRVYLPTVQRGHVP